jgi:hypothetical protein
MPRAPKSLSFRDLALLRLRNQRLIDKPCKKPEDVVGWLGVVQAQDYYGATWALAQRTKNPNAAAVERAFSAGAILRTHVLRPTWHFVLPADIRSLLALSAPRVKALMRPYDRKLGIDERVLARSHEVLTAAMSGGRFATRNQLATQLAAAGIEAKGQRLGHLMMHAELDALICSGPRQGKQFTYALLDERAAPTPALSRTDALAALTLRFFTSHGPALPQDFAWWSGLTIGDAKAGLKSVGDVLSQLEIAGRTYWHAGHAEPPQLKAPIVHLLPNYDEHLIAYKERSAAFDRERVATLGPHDTVIGNHLITLDGQVIGGWRREEAAIEINLITRLKAQERQALNTAQARLAEFLTTAT